MPSIILYFFLLIVSVCGLLLSRASMLQKKLIHKQNLHVIELSCVILELTEMISLKNHKINNLQHIVNNLSNTDIIV